MKYLIKDILPCWYELSWQDDAANPAIIVRIHKDFLEQLKGVMPRLGLPLGLAAGFQLRSFQDNWWEESFGFEDAFKRQLDQTEFTCFSVNLPKVRKAETIECGMCHGSGAGCTEGENCLSCKGNGYEHVIDWHDAFAVSASFTVFFVITFYNELETSAQIPQLLTVQTTTKADVHGGSLNGMYSIPLVQWLGSKAGRELGEMKAAMIRAYEFMSESELYNHRFYARVESPDGWLNVSCPGDACGLNPGHGSLEGRIGRGYEFGCHNVDSPLQQLTLLAGLAALHDQARRELTHY